MRDFAAAGINDLSVPRSRSEALAELCPLRSSVQRSWLLVERGTSLLGWLGLITQVVGELRFISFPLHFFLGVLAQERSWWLGHGVPTGSGAFKQELQAGSWQGQMHRKPEVDCQVGECFTGFMEHALLLCSNWKPEVSPVIATNS